MNTVNPTTNTGMKTDAPVDAHAMTRKDIQAKWDKFSANDVSAFKSKDELVTQIVAKYGTEKGQALRDVDAVLKGRQLS